MASPPSRLLASDPTALATPRLTLFQQTARASVTRRPWGSRLAPALLLLAWAAGAPAAVEDRLPEAPNQYVTDLAGALPRDRAEALARELEQFERETSNQILVWIAPRVPEGFALEDFAVRAFRKWGVGQKDKSNGAVLFVFPEERKLRIEVGYGLEGVLPDAIANRIIQEEIVPRFRSGDYAGGIEAGARAMMAAAKGEYKGSGSTVAQRRGGSGRGGGPRHSVA